MLEDVNKESEDFVEHYEQLLYSLYQCRKLSGKNSVPELNDIYCHMKPAWSKFDQWCQDNGILEFEYPYKKEEL